MDFEPIRILNSSPVSVNIIDRSPQERNSSDNRRMRCLCKDAESSAMLIATKLRPPRVAQDFLPRPHLYAALEHGRTGKLTLICAPAGYGKSTLAAAWLASSGHAHVWISLDPSDSDLGQCLSYLAHGLSNVAPHAGARLAHILQSATLPPPDFIAANLINDLDEIETPLIIVLDDFHFIEHADTLRLTASLAAICLTRSIVMITQRPGAALGPNAGKAGTGRNSDATVALHGSGRGDVSPANPGRTGTHRQR
ncbi:MAG: hypothetical protein R2851_04335 [Caldilineaceae bacterium]